MHNVDMQNSQSSQAIVPQLKTFFASSDKREAIVKSLFFLAMFFERPLPEETQLGYITSLSDLTPEQLALGFSTAAREAKFWPSPGTIRELARVENKAQISERRALEDLAWLVDFIRKHGSERSPRARRGELIREAYRDEDGEYHGPRYEEIPPPPAPDTVRNAVRELGCGEGHVGVKIIAMHPLLAHDPDLSLGLTLSAIEKLEARWVSAWCRGNQEVGEK